MGRFRWNGGLIMINQWEHGSIQNMKVDPARSECFIRQKLEVTRKKCGFDQKVECNQRNLTCWKLAIWIPKNMDVTLLIQPKPTWECGYASRSNSDAIAQQPYPGAMATLLQELRVGDHPSTPKYHRSGNIGFGKMRFLRSNLVLPVVCTFSSKKGWEMLGDNCDDLRSPFIRSQKVSAGDRKHVRWEPTDKTGACKPGSEWPDGARISYQTNSKLEMYPPEIPLR
jgi:hypothetical protein